MKRIFNWKVAMGLALTGLSAALYYIHYFVFRDSHHIFIYLVGDIAFVPVEVLIVTLIIHNLLEKREKSALLNKMNMLIGAFFSEAGNRLLEALSDLDPGISVLKPGLKPGEDWQKKDFIAAKESVRGHECKVAPGAGELSLIRDILRSKRSFLMSLLANPMLLEHDSFTDLLWAVFHLTEELDKRKDLSDLPGEDLEHLINDIKRAYRALLTEWLDYMAHLQSAYPYLFSLARRTNPFDDEARISIGSREGSG
ncbi:MAG: hypothetical protein GF392_02705 [Candidatus Omnitrophica bacterium]|nr:hypothetical protein [Candidatus Omnitrophota bacterium]